MGAAQSTESPVRRVAVQPPPYTTLDEKFDAVHISHGTTSTTSRGVLSSRDLSTVSAARVQEYIVDLLKDPKNQLGLAALSKNNINAVLERPSTIVADRQVFNVAIPHEVSPVTNQRASGRCWIFAATNVFRIALSKKYKLETCKFELSQAYLFFWDKVEKANYFLEATLLTADEDIDGRLVSTLSSSPVGDGGQWDMIVNLVSKYGLVPQSLYPDSFNAKSSYPMDSLITTKLRQDALVLRALKNKGASVSDIAEAKQRMMQDIVRILTITLGPPPPADKPFTWEYYDSKKTQRTVTTTPLDFAASINVKKYFSLVNDPRNAYDRLLTVDLLGNVWQGQPITYVNVDKDLLKSSCVEMLKAGLPIFFGSDVGKQSDSSYGIMDTDLVDYELGFDIKLGLTKAQRLQTGESAMTHAMVLTAVHLDSDGKPVRWRVENSWSETAGTDGYFVMSDKWMDEFVYQAVVDPDFVSKEVKDILKQKPKVLPRWDPMGALA